MATADGATVTAARFRSAAPDSPAAAAPPPPPLLPFAVADTAADVTAAVAVASAGGGTLPLPAKRAAIATAAPFVRASLRERSATPPDASATFSSSSASVRAGSARTAAEFERRAERGGGATRLLRRWYVGEGAKATTADGSESESEASRAVLEAKSAAATVAARTDLIFSLLASAGPLRVRGGTRRWSGVGEKRMGSGAAPSSPSRASTQ
mmetsp:Transcript_6415/g.18831  ORF Transcript_6415/g.18831 Transcript_6415/m.18831 type:complete len:211 (-) Transcript_6415:154-786(-)